MANSSYNITVRRTKAADGSGSGTAISYSIQAANLEAAKDIALERCKKANPSDNYFEVTKAS